MVVITTQYGRTNSKLLATVLLYLMNLWQWCIATPGPAGHMLYQLAWSLWRGYTQNYLPNLSLTLRKAILDGPENGYGTHSEFLPWDFIHQSLDYKLWVTGALEILIAGIDLCTLA